MAISSNKRGSALLPLLAIGLVAACGSTVQVRSQGGTTLSGDGLSAPTTSGQVGASGATTPTDTGTTSTGGSGGSLGSGTGGPVRSVTGPAATGPTSVITTGPTSIPSSGTKITTPIQIGFMAAASGTAAISAIGASQNGTSETPQDAMAYFVSALNAKGGVDGRKVQIVQSFIDPSSSNYDTQGEAACANFTQDHHVAAVFSVEAAYYTETFSACVAKAHVPELTALWGGTTTSTLAKYPLLVSPTAPTVERRFKALLTGVIGDGFLSPKTKLGIIVEDCPQNESAYTSTIAPMLKAQGISATRRDVSCVHGFGDAAGFIASMGSQVLPLNSAGVNRVMFVSGFEGIAAEYFERAAKNQGFRPSYALTSTSDAGDNSMGFTADAMSRVQGVGWEPDLDVTKLLPGTAATQRCRALWKGYGPAASRSNRQNNETTCEEFFLLEASLAQTHGLSTGSALVTSILGLGTTYQSPLALGGATDYTSARKDGPQLFATFGYSAACSCFVYTSAPKPLA